MFATSSVIVGKSKAGVLDWSRLTSGAAAMPARSNLVGQLSAFEQVGRGALLVDEQARVLEFNSCVRFGDGLQLSKGFLQTPRPEDRRRLERFLSDVMAQNKPTSPVPVTLALPRPSGLHPWLVDGIDFTETMRGARAAALLLIIDVERPARLPPELLTEVFGLTATEAKLACELACGKSLQEISAQLSISAGHARQRLKIIFNKTRTSRQGELIALLAKFG
jgi:DNA-binding CsgD family transcriptional regulator